jgi:endonuclease III
MKELLISIVLTTFCLCTKAQSITGKIGDNEGHPIDAASIILLRSDSTFVEATLSNPDGSFTFNKGIFPSRIVIQHMSYQTKIIVCKTPSLGNISLDEKANMLKELVVTAERPFVKVENGALSYDLSALSTKKAVNNVYEALAELPGVNDNSGNLTLAGASNLSIILDGKPTTMTKEELNTLLRSMPVDRVQNVEVTYSAPPQYHVRGAAINIKLKRASGYSFQQEIKAGYTNQYFSSENAGTNFRITTPKIALDVLYNATDSKDMSRLDLDSHHLFQNKTYDIIQNQMMSNKGWNHNLHGSFNYNISKKSSLNIAYTSNIDPKNNGLSKSNGNYLNSEVDKQSHNYMHNISAQYLSAFGMNLNMDYTNYHSTNNQQFTSISNNTTNTFDINGGQHIEKLSFGADQEHKLKKNWALGYGLSYSNAYDKDHQFYSDIKGNMQTLNTDSKITEQTTDFYIRTSKNYARGKSFSFSASGEYYTIGNYHKWAFYPQASWTYAKDPKHIFILSLSSDKKYPSYWDMQSSVTHLDGYAEIQGTSNLRPCSTYKLTGTYVLNHKYTFTAFYEDMRDYFTQVAYQSSQRLALIYQTRNWDYSCQCGVAANIPFKVQSWLDSHFYIVGLRLQQRCDDYFDVPFNRKRFVALTGINNTFNLTHTLSLNLNGSYTSPPIQGTYDLTHIFKVSTSMKWTFCKNKATLSTQLNDIFNSGTPKVKVNYKGQNLNMNTGYYTRLFNLTFSYRFGGYKEKEHKGVDTSRFGH